MRELPDLPYPIQCCGKQVQEFSTKHSLDNERVSHLGLECLECGNIAVSEPSIHDSKKHLNIWDDTITRFKKKRG